jgi:copper chaperone NosL
MRAMRFACSRACSGACFGACLVTMIMLAGCDETPVAGAGAVPVAVEPGADAIGYYCNMTVADHPGPKGQAFVAGKGAPLWFSSVRDTLAFTRLPGEPKNIAALYVNDMGRASWDRPEPGTWIDARSAWYVAGSVLRGGMGAPEVVPFAERAAPDAFAVRHGGTVSDFSSVPADAVVGAVSSAGDDGKRAPVQAANDHVQHASSMSGQPAMQAMQTTAGTHAHSSGEGHAHEPMHDHEEVSR